LETGTQGTRSRQTMSLWRRLTGTPWIAVYAILALAAALLIALAAREAWLLGRAADSGLAVDTQLRVIAAEPAWEGVGPGQRVVAIEGRALDDYHDWMRALRSLEPGPVTVRIEIGDRIVDRTAEARPHIAVHHLALWVRVVTGTALFLLGLGAFLLRPGAVPAWLLLGASWVLGAWMLGETIPGLILPVSILAMPLAGSLMLHFLAVFPRPISWLEKGPERAALLYLPAGVLVAAQLATAATAGSLTGPGSQFGLLHLLRFAWLGVGALIGTGLALVHYRSSRDQDPRARARARGLLLAMVGGVVVPTLWSVTRHLLGVGEGRFASYYNSVPLLFFVGMSAYVVVRHNAFAIDRFTAAVVGYALAAGFVALGFLAVLFGLPLALGARVVEQSPAALVAVTVAVFLASAPLYRAVRARIDRRFFRERTDAGRLAEALRQLVYTVRGARQEALSTSLSVARMVQTTRAELWQLDEDGGCLYRWQVSGTGAPALDRIDRAGPLARAMADGLGGGVDHLAPRALPGDAQDQLWDLSLAMVVPVHAHGALVGMLGVERRRSGAAYDYADLSLLTIVAGQIGMALERDDTERREIGRYRVVRRLGVGGMAEVFLAYQLGAGGIERKVALKRPLPQLAHEPAFVDLFLDEARISTQLQHPNIAQVYEVGEGEDGFFLAMEFVDGEALRAILRLLRERGDTVPPPIALTLAGGVLRALAHAHSRCDDDGQSLGVVHRDVTPGNVMVTRDGVVKLLDFGIARAATQAHTTRAGVVRGTLAYMSPEHATGKPVDSRSDLYAVATLLYEMLTGRKAFPQGPILRPWKPGQPAPAPPPPVDEEDSDPTRESRAARSAPGPRPPPPASVLADNLAPAVDQVLYRAQSFRSDDRYPDATAMLEALEQAFAVRPARPEEVAAWLRELEAAPPLLTAPG
jgi:serine/threonine protein kinase